MWRLYDKKYGKYGEAKCKQLQALVEKKEEEANSLRGAIIRLQEALSIQGEMYATAQVKIAELEEKLEEISNDVNVLRDQLSKSISIIEPLPGNPYEENNNG